MQQHFKEKHFRLFSSFLENNYGVRYARGKAEMLHIKIHKLMVMNGMASYDKYYEFVTRKDGHDQLTQFLDELTTHTTDFFRENDHFEYIKHNISGMLGKNRRIRENNEFRAWSAACSTGEEPYSLAMTLKENLPEGTYIKILATDISRKAIAAATKGVYSSKTMNEVGKYYMNKYFSRVGDACHVAEDIKQLVFFRIFNLMEPFQFKKGFDMIFCRNVMIYFDSLVQTKLVEKMYDVLVPGGLLFIGHSEGLAFKEHRFKYVQPSVYMKD